MDNKLNSIKINNTVYDLEDGRVDNLASWAFSSNKPSYIYQEIGYGVETLNNASNIITIDGSKPVHVLNLNGDVSSVILETLPLEGHGTRVFFCSNQQRSVTITHHNTNRVCPKALNLSLTVTANGYTEVDFLKANNKVYVISCCNSGSSGSGNTEPDNTEPGNTEPISTKSMVASSNNILLNPISGATSSITVKYDDDTLVSNLIITNGLSGCNYTKADSDNYTTITFTSTETNTDMEDNKDLGYITLSDGESEITVDVYQKPDYVVDTNLYSRNTNYYPEHAKFSLGEETGRILYTDIQGYGTGRYVELEFLSCHPSVLCDKMTFHKSVTGQEVDITYKNGGYTRCYTSYNPNSCIFGKIYYNTDNYSGDHVMYCKEYYHDRFDQYGQHEHVKITFHIEYSTTDKHNYHVKATSPEGDYVESDIVINW